MNMNRQRSPNYPQISLPEAIERIRAVYDAIHTARADQDQVLSMLGYNTRSGTSGGVLSGLRKYGLLEGSGDSFRVSNDAVTILERQPDHPERIAALNRAAFAPTLFSEIRDHFHENHPSDEDLRIYLVTRGFSRTATDGVIRTYRETMQLVVADRPGYTAAEDRNHQSEDTEANQAMQAAQQPITPRSGVAAPAAPVAPVAQAPQTGESAYAFRISRDSEARVIFNGQVTQEAVEKLIALLEASKDTFPKKLEIVEIEAEKYHNEAVWYVSQGHHEEAVESLKKGIALYKKHLDKELLNALPQYQFFLKNLSSLQESLAEPK